MAGNAKPYHAFLNNLLVDGDMSGPLTSQSKDINTVVSVALQAVWSGTTPVGSFNVQASNIDEDAAYVTIAEVEVTGNTGAALVNIERPGYAYVRAVYVFTSGTGTISININGKQ